MAYPACVESGKGAKLDGMGPSSFFQPQAHSGSVSHQGLAPTPSSLQRYSCGDPYADAMPFPGSPAALELNQDGIRAYPEFNAFLPTPTPVIEPVARSRGAAGVHVLVRRGGAWLGSRGAAPVRGNVERVRKTIFLLANPFHFALQSSATRSCVITS